MDLQVPLPVGDLTTALKTANENEIILVKKYRDSFMPNNFEYINIDNPVENSLEIKYKSDATFQWRPLNCK